MKIADLLLVILVLIPLDCRSTASTDLLSIWLAWP